MEHPPAAAATGPSRPATATQRSGVDLSVLGPWALHVDGEPVEVGRRQVRTILTRLALSRDPIGAEALIELLWPTELPTDPRSALNVVLSRCRSALGPHVHALDSTGTAYRLRATTDAGRFCEQVDQAMSPATAERATALRAALALWRGDPFVDLAEHPTFTYESHRLNAVRDRARTALLDALVVTHRYDEVIDLAGPLVEREPHRVAETIALATALSGIGRRQAALRTLAELRRQEGLVGLEASACISTAESAILSSSTDLDPTTAPTPAGVLILGRDAELNRLATVPSGKIVFVTGEPGIGKSTLVEVATERWRAMARAVFTVAASTTPPRLMDPVGQLLEACIAEHGRPNDPAERAAIAVVVPDPQESTEGWIAARDELVSTLARYVAGCCAQGTVVTIDNAHLVDALSAEVFGLLAQNDDITLVLASPHQQGVVAEDAVDERIVLAPLGVDDVDDWIQKEADWSDVDAAALRHRTGGNPMFLKLLIELISDELSTESLPATLVATVQRRMDRLSPAARTLLVTAAGLGETVPLALLDLLCDDIVAASRELETRGLVEIGPHTLSTRHGLVVEAVAQIHGDGSRLATLDAAARVAEQAGRPPIEYWRYCVETALIDPARALRASVSAAESYAEVYDWDGVSACTHAGHEIVGTGRHDLSNSLRLRVLEARARFGAGELGGEELLLEVVDDARRADDTPSFVAAVTALSQAGCFALLGRDPAQLSELIAEALTVTETAEERAWLRASAARSLGFSRFHRTGQAYYRDAVAQLDDIHDARARWTILRNAEYGLALPADLSEAERLNGLMDVEMGSNPEINFLVAFTRFRHAIVRGDAHAVAKGQADARAAEHRATSTDAPLRYGHAVATTAQLAWIDAGVELMCGHPELAEQHANRSIEAVRQAVEHRDEKSVMAWATTGYGALLVAIRHAQGRLAELEALAAGTGATVPAWRGAVTAIRLAAGDAPGARTAMEPLVQDGWAGLPPDQASSGVIHLLADTATEIMSRAEIEQLAAIIAPHTDRFSLGPSYSLGPLSLAAASLSDALGRSDAGELRERGRRAERSFRERLRRSDAVQPQRAPVPA